MSSPYSNPNPNPNPNPHHNSNSNSNSNLPPVPDSTPVTPDPVTQSKSLPDLATCT